jgi:large subunit ribosomal protein L33
MAKASYQLVQLVNEEETTKTKYIIRVPTRGQKASEKIRLRKYDPTLRRHCWFAQKRLPNPKAK